MVLKSKFQKPTTICSVVTQNYNFLSLFQKVTILTLGNKKLQVFDACVDDKWDQAIYHLRD
jgi:hypothetical protein